MGMPDSRQSTIDTGLWWHQRKDDQRSIEQELAFHKEMLNCLLYIVATMATEFQDFKDNSRTQSDTHLFLPKGLHLEKDK